MIFRLPATKGASVSRREVKRVLDAVDALEAIPDAGDRAKATGELLAEVPALQSKLRQMRQQCVLTLRAQGMSWQEIGDLLDVSRGRAKRIAEGTSWRKQGDMPLA